jgi:hypothetical protein
MQMLDVKKISEILGRGNTAEVKKTKDGIMILEVKRKIKYRGSTEEQSETDGAEDIKK